MSDVQSCVCEHMPSVADAGGSERSQAPDRSGRLWTALDGSGRSMLVKAKSGTGKTLAFLILAVQRQINSIGPVRCRIISGRPKPSSATSRAPPRRLAPATRKPLTR